MTEDEFRHGGVKMQDQAKTTEARHDTARGTLLAGDGRLSARKTFPPDEADELPFGHIVLSSLQDLERRLSILRENFADVGNALSTHADQVFGENPRSATLSSGAGRNEVAPASSRYSGMAGVTMDQLASLNHTTDLLYQALDYVGEQARRNQRIA